MTTPDADRAERLVTQSPSASERVEATLAILARTNREWSSLSPRERHDRVGQALVALHNGTDEAAEIVVAGIGTRPTDRDSDTGGPR